jgi:hypothetical protein
VADLVNDHFAANYAVEALLETTSWDEVHSRTENCFEHVGSILRAYLIFFLTSNLEEVHENLSGSLLNS